MARLVVPVLLLLASGAWAGEHRQTVLDLLGAYEEPPKQAELVALGAGVDAELMAIADDGAVPHSRRANAVIALQWFPSDTVRTFLVAHLEPGADALLRRKAATSLGAFGPVAVPDLTKALADADVHVRAAAARALGTIADPSARQALEQRLPVETDASVKSAITKSLGTP